MGAIFEMGRSFRNEGADATHNPEFTSLEVYKAGSDYREMMTLTRQLYQAAARAIHGKEIALRPAGSPETSDESGEVEFVEVDISGDWRVISVFDAVSEAVGTVVTPDTGEEELRSLCLQHHLTQAEPRMLAFFDEAAILPGKEVNLQPENGRIAVMGVDTEKTVLLDTSLGQHLFVEGVFNRD